MKKRIFLKLSFKISEGLGLSVKAKRVFDKLLRKVSPVVLETAFVMIRYSGGD